VEINDLTVLHFNEGKSDKVWGYFCTPIAGIAKHYKFWGKRTGKGFQTQIQNPTKILDDALIKEKKGYNKSSSLTFNMVLETLEIQFGITKFKSVVTEEEQSVADGIKPSQVYKTQEAWAEKRWVINFYDKKDNLIGVRSAEHKENIFIHLEKTRYSIPNPNDKNIVLWNKKPKAPK